MKLKIFILMLTQLALSAGAMAWNQTELLYDGTIKRTIDKKDDHVRFTYNQKRHDGPKKLFAVNKNGEYEEAETVNELMFLSEYEKMKYCEEQGLVVSNGGSSSGGPAFDKNPEISENFNCVEKTEGEKPSLVPGYYCMHETNSIIVKDICAKLTPEEYGAREWLDLDLLPQDSGTSVYEQGKLKDQSLPALGQK